MANLLLINGSIRGPAGNTARLLAYAQSLLVQNHHCDVLHLADEALDAGALETRLRQADGFIVASGTYWNSHSSALQRFIECVTPLEGTKVFVGKPVAALITMDSVGGIEVAQRLLGTFNLFGCVIPAFASLVLSRLSMHPASRALGDDIWQPADVKCTLDNLVALAQKPRAPCAYWPVFRAPPPPDTYPAPGRMHVDDAPWQTDWWPPSSVSS